MPGGEPDRRGGQGLPLHPRRDERRAHPDRGGVHRRRQVLHRPRQRLRQGARGVRPADRREPGRAVPDRPRLCPDDRRQPDGRPGRGPVRGRRALRHRGQHGQARWPPRPPGSPPTCALQTHGGFGFAEEYDIERKFRETRLYQVAPISTNLILSHVATHVLDLPKSASDARDDQPERRRARRRRRRPSTGREVGQRAVHPDGRGAAARPGRSCAARADLRCVMLARRGPALPGRRGPQGTQRHDRRGLVGAAQGLRGHGPRPARRARSR